ncbi:MAG: dicarboxylate/amino acid:cation symporter [Planctomycetota bacterium]|nr:MAG: dicarboxylate/amino acid:cation symporter [Planctomycetota bacterium]
MVQILRRISLSQWILVAMVAGVLLGLFLPQVSLHLNPLSSTIFMRLIKSLIAPLLFATLVVGIAGHCEDLRQMGRLAIRAFVYFEVATTVALFIGLGAVNLTRPGVGIDTTRANAEQAQVFAGKQASVDTFLEHVFPASVVEAAAKNEVLQLVIWAVIFAIALVQTPEKYRLPILEFLEALAQVMFKFTGLVMLYAPIAIGAAIAFTVAKSGPEILGNLALLVLTLYGALVVFCLVVLLPVMVIFRVPVAGFWQVIREPALLAFSSASSEAALPKAMQNLEAFGVPRRIVAFVLPTGYSFNLDGSTLYLAVASIFCFQAAGVHLAFTDQLLMMLMLMLTSKGVAAVPRASLVILSGTLVSFGAYLEGKGALRPDQLTVALAAVGTILGVDAFMDMARTSINLVGNCLATVVMARWEGEFQQDNISPSPSAESLTPSH